jgi:hypothetical protein
VWLALLGAAAVLLTLMVVTRAPRAELLTHAPGTQSPRLSFLGGSVRSTLRNLRFKLFGPPRAVAISAEIFACHEFFSPAPDSLPAPVAVNQTSTRLWLLDTNQWAVLRNHMQSNGASIANPSIWTFEGHPAKMFIGESLLLGGARQQAGIAFDVSARARGSEVDLTSFFTLTAAFTNAVVPSNSVSVRTNLALGMRAQIPQEHRLFLLTSNAVDGKRIGVIVSATIRESKK